MAVSMSAKKLGVWEAVALILGLIGTGIQLRWPEQKWVGWVFIALGVAVAFGVIVWALAQRSALKGHAALSSRLTVPTHTQTLHAPITNTNNPVFAPVFAPNFNQSQTQQLTAIQKETRDPVFEVRGTPIPRYGFNTETGQLIRERYEGDPSQILDHIKFVDVALAKILYRQDRGVDPRLRISAHIFFYEVTPETQQLKDALLEVYEPLWDDDEPHVSQEFSAGYVHDLILGLVPAVDQPSGVIGYEYGTHLVPTYTGSEREFLPKIHNLFGFDFLIKVDLIPKVANEIRCELPPFWFRLSLLSKPMLRKVSSDNPLEK
jgi:hypothetical protein